MVDFGNWDVFISTFEEPFGVFYYIGPNRPNILQKCQNANTCELGHSGNYGIVYKIGGTLFTNQNIKIKMNNRKIFRKSSRDKWF